MPTATCASKLHRNPPDTHLLACGHRGRRYIELVHWPDGVFHIFVAGGTTSHLWSVSERGVFKGEFSPWVAFKYDVRRYLSGGSYQHVDEAALEELEREAALHTTNATR